MRDYDDIGYPAEPTKVYPATDRIGPRLMRQEEREARIEATRKWRQANLQRELEKERAYQRARHAKRLARHEETFRE
jgi:hypothetical protein